MRCAHCNKPIRGLPDLEELTPDGRLLSYDSWVCYQAAMDSEEKAKARQKRSAQQFREREGLTLIAGRNT